MKTHYTLESTNEIDFSVLAINSHAKAYKLCWNINKTLELDFEKTDSQKISDKLFFSRYHHITKEGYEYDILTNRSKEGYLMPEYKSVNYFLILNNQNQRRSTDLIIEKLKHTKEVLMVFEIDVTSSKYLERFIFNDKKN
jgi:hypothetical protein